MCGKCENLIIAFSIIAFSEYTTRMKGKKENADQQLAALVMLCVESARISLLLFPTVYRTEADASNKSAEGEESIKVPIKLPTRVDIKHCMKIVRCSEKAEDDLTLDQKSDLEMFLYNLLPAFSRSWKGQGPRDGETDVLAKGFSDHVTASDEAYGYYILDNFPNAGSGEDDEKGENAASSSSSDGQNKKDGEKDPRKSRLTGKKRKTAQEMYKKDLVELGTERENMSQEQRTASNFLFKKFYANRGNKEKLKKLTTTGSGGTDSEDAKAGPSKRCEQSRVSFGQKATAALHYSSV